MWEEGGTSGIVHHCGCVILRAFVSFFFVYLSKVRSRIATRLFWSLISCDRSWKPFRKQNQKPKWQTHSCEEKQPQPRSHASKVCWHGWMPNAGYVVRKINWKLIIVHSSLKFLTHQGLLELQQASQSCMAPLPKMVSCTCMLKLLAQVSNKQVPCTTILLEK